MLAAHVRPRLQLEEYFRVHRLGLECAICLRQQCLVNRGEQVQPRGELRRKRKKGSARALEDLQNFELTMEPSTKAKFKRARSASPASSAGRVEAATSRERSVAALLIG